MIAIKICSIVILLCFYVQVFAVTVESTVNNMQPNPEQQNMLISAADKDANEMLNLQRKINLQKMAEQSQNKTSLTATSSNYVPPTQEYKISNILINQNTNYKFASLQGTDNARTVIVGSKLDNGSQTISDININGITVTEYKNKTKKFISY